MMKIFKAIAITGAMLALSACAQTIKSDVARFHQLGGVANGATFSVVPADDALQGSLEFAQYAGLVRAKMMALGFQPVNAANQSDLVVKMAYGVSDGDQVIRTRFNGAGGFGGPWGRRGGFGFYDPFFFGGGFGGGFGGPDVYSYSVFTRDLQMQIFEPATPGDIKKVVFEGNVKSVGRDNGLPEVMPYLVEAMFTDFPGPSGETREVVIEVPRGES